MSYSNIFELTKLLTSHKVFVDTCSFMHTEAHIFFSRLIPELECRRVQINIPLSVTAEIVQNMAEDRPNQCRTNANKAFDIVNRLVANKLANHAANNSNKTFADHVFEIFLESERMDSNILLITQDKALAKRAKVNLYALRRYFIVVFYGFRLIIKKFGSNCIEIIIKTIFKASKQSIFKPFGCVCRY